MCSESVLTEITNKVVQAARDSLGDRLDRVILYGSYARGDYSGESDIDIIVLADIPLEDRSAERRKIRKLLGYIDLDYDVVLSLNVTDCGTFNRYAPVEPFYMNVLRDGVILSA